MAEMLIIVTVIVVIFMYKSKVDATLNWTGQVIEPFGDSIKDTAVSASSLTGAGRIKAHDVLLTEAEESYDRNLIRTQKKAKARAKMSKEEIDIMKPHDEYLTKLVERNK